MRVLPSILSHARDIALDIARVQMGFVERRRAVVEIGAAIPLSISSMLLDTLTQASGFRLAALNERQVTPHVRHLGKPHEVIQEESQPDAFVLAMFADHIRIGRQGPPP